MMLSISIAVHSQFTFYWEIEQMIKSLNVPMDLHIMFVHSFNTDALSV